jgi:hypothetical protein
MDLSPCSGCGECYLRCSAGVQMTRPEVDAVNAHIAGMADPVGISQITAQDKSVDLGDGVTVELCRYYDMVNGGCSVYPARPLVCRLLGHVEWMPCPIGKIEKIADTQDALVLMREYARETRHTFEEWDAITSLEAQSLF